MPNYPELADQGAYSADAVYTPEDVAEIVSYAGAVRPIPFRFLPTYILIDTQRGIDVLVVRNLP